MTKKWGLGLAAALLVFSAASAWAAPAKKKKAAKPADDEAEASLGESKSVDKKRFEFYLKERLKKIKEAHQARVDYFAKEQEIWTSFWNRVRDERQQFEIRITRQTLDLFESLASLEQKDYPLTISNFEKLQSDVIRAFEAQQKTKMADFFASREARWREFAVDQEKERADFVADAEQGWKDNKASLKNPEESPSAAKASDEGGSDEEPAPRKPKAKPAKAKATASASPDKKVKASDAEDKWH